jgi:hypothetical protein
MVRTAIATVLCLLAAAPPAAALAAGPSPFAHELGRAERALRKAVEDRPVALGEGLLSSETVCRLAAESEGRGAGDEAAASWSTLTQLSDRVDSPAADAVDRALLRADSLLVGLRGRFATAWATDPRRVRKLQAGVDRSRSGIRGIRAATKQMTAALPAWRGHDCATATAATEAGLEAMPAAIEKLSDGMWRLWILAEAKGP